MQPGGIDIDTLDVFKRCLAALFNKGLGIRDGCSPGDGGRLRQGAA